MSVISIIIAIIIFSILVVVHEFGHFLLAKKNGIYVIEFSVGFGPRLLSFKKGETRYSWKLIPFGGACAMLGEDGLNEENELEQGYDMERAFHKKSVWARISVVAAGPVFNFILAFVMALIVIGFVGSDPAYVDGVTEGSPAAEAGLQEGDVITKYNGSSVSLGRDIYLEEYLNPVSADSPITLTVNRDGETLDFTIQPVKKEKQYLGFQYNSDTTEAKVTVVAGGPLEKAGVQDNDVITEIDGVSIATGADLTAYLKENPLTAEPVTLKIKRDDTVTEYTVTPGTNTYYETGFSYNMYRSTEGNTGLTVIKYSFIEMGYQVRTVFKSLGALFTGKVGVDQMSGPVGIVDVISDAVEETSSEGFGITVLTLFNFIILLSANLGVMNLLPFPALDGGRLVFLLIEAVRGKPIAREKEGMVHFVGLILLMALMVFIMYNDIVRLFQ